ncbi:kettin homolog isoform X2 [Ostrea edulis]|uniref:kettin homolog isoform X2 n=1 Tax=Ostrea edulis TaxID=37623 RepID=UPI0024AF0858|nr:kettin homolog isoform X2 [Ostrea edulis]
MYHSCIEKGDETIKPAFSPEMPTTAWTWKNAPGNLTCEVEGDPRPTVKWFTIPNESGERTQISEGGFYSFSTKYKGLNTVISTLRVVYDFSTPLGEYLCKATINLGSTNRTIRLRKADSIALWSGDTFSLVLRGMLHR